MAFKNINARKDLDPPPPHLFGEVLYSLNLLIVCGNYVPPPSRMYYRAGITKLFLYVFTCYSKKCFKWLLTCQLAVSEAVGYACVSQRQAGLKPLDVECSNHLAVPKNKGSNYLVVSQYKITPSMKTTVLWSGFRRWDYNLRFSLPQPASLCLKSEPDS